MSYLIQLSEQAENDLIFFKKSGNKIILDKITNLLSEITITPFVGTGKPEALKYELAGKWSRRINKEHRLVYEVQDEVVLVHSLKDHYV